jgi:chromosome segregation ATPase
MTFFDSILNYLGLRTQESYQTVVAKLSEHRDAFEEQVYDVKWRLEQVQEELTQAATRICTMQVAHEDALDLVHSVHTKEMRDAGRALDQLQELRRSICEHGEIQLEMDELRVSLATELDYANLTIRKMREQERALERSHYEKERALKQASGSLAIAKEDLKDAQQYKPLYFSALEDLKKLRAK